MKIYFEYKGSTKGPIELSELSKYEINQNTNVWYDGLDNWTPAGEIALINERLPKLPPPLPGTEITEADQEITDGRSQLRAAGIGLFVLGLAAVFVFQFLQSAEEQLVATASEKDHSIQIIGSILSLILRGWAISMVRPFARMLLRDDVGWSVFAFLLPSIAMIVLSFQSVSDEEN